jgi:ubiquinone/menaquinone biosynthesis C-methylase UbiE
MIPRVLEPEIMDSADDAAQYDAMDHSVVNTAFATDLLAALKEWSLQRPVTLSTTLNILDLGAGTAQIPIELAGRAPDIHITAVDAAKNMLALAEKNVSAVGLLDRISLLLADAKQLPFDSDAFDVVVSNSILHHIPDPEAVISEAVRVTAPGGILFHRDLARPDDDNAVLQLVASYTVDATSYQRRLFAESLHAALTAEEMRNFVAPCAFDRESVRMTSDRHWTWAATKA